VGLEYQEEKMVVVVVVVVVAVVEKKVVINVVVDMALVTQPARMLLLQKEIRTLTF